jgi:membrane protein DedA with SNARE-associated domain
VSALVERVLGLHGLAIYLTVGLLVFAEDAIFVGFVVPGETAAILGGVAASRGNASVVLLCIIVVVAAILGDNIGYFLGRRYGARVLATGVLRRRERRVERARRYLADHGGPAVLAGRYIAFLRAVVPFLAGTARLSYGRFLAYNIIGGVTWGVGSVLLGFLAGNSYKQIESALGPATAAALGILVVLALIVWIVQRHRSERRKDEAESDAGDAVAADAEAADAAVNDSAAADPDVIGRHVAARERPGPVG